MATIQHSMWVPSPGLSLMMSSSLGDTMLEQSSDYAVAGVEDMLYGERLAGEEELDPWVLFVQASFQRHIPPSRGKPRPKRRRR